jgi:hypothetical protein
MKEYISARNLRVCYSRNMAVKYARIPGINLMATVLQNIPTKFRVVRHKKAAMKRSAPMIRCAAVAKITKDVVKRCVPIAKITAAKITKDVVKRCVPTAKSTKDVVKRRAPAAKILPDVGKITKDVVKQRAPAAKITKDVVKQRAPAAKILPDVVKRSALVKLIAAIKASTKVYVLQLHGGFIYVGQSSNVDRRIHQHMNGQGAMFTRRHKPTGIVLPRLGNINGAGDSGERQEVLLQMRLHGMQRVRGWKYVNDNLSMCEVADIKSNWIEMFNLCRVCMGEGHMASFCKKRKYSNRR